MDLGLDMPVASATSTPPGDRAGCGKTAGFYRPRDPRRSAFYQLIEEHFSVFQAVYAQRYQERYGYWRPIVTRVVEAFLRCGDRQQGFARVRCPECGHELFVAFSCKQRCLCPSCHEKRALGTARHVSETVCAAVPHRQFVFTLPKRFRLYFRSERGLLGELALCAWQTVCAVYQAAAGSAGVPGMMAGLQTFGDLLHWHPHVHALATEGVFDAHGQFVPLPRLASEPFLKLWEQKVFHLLVSRGKISPEVMAEMKTWPHSGFSVDQSVRLEAGDKEGVARLVQYILRCPFSQARLLKVTPEGQVLYKATRAQCHRFPEPGSDDLSEGVKRNYQIFAPLDFLAEVTQHLPEKGEHLIRYYGDYSNKSRGLRAQANAPLAGKPTMEPGPTSQQARKHWAALIKQVYEVDPLRCPQCGGTTKIISFIEAPQRDVIEKILRHCGLWEERRGRDPPPAKAEEPGAKSELAQAEVWPAEEVQDFPPDEQNPGWEVSWAEYGE